MKITQMEFDNLISHQFSFATARGISKGFLI